jgi:hypothetical protein
MDDCAKASERLLARLFVDAELRAELRRDPNAVGRAYGLSGEALLALSRTDFVGLELAARSYSLKREHRSRKG